MPRKLLDCSLVVFALKVFFKLVMRYQVIGRQHLMNLPVDSRGIILASEHFTNWDPFFVGSVIPWQVQYFAKESLLKIPIFGRLLARYGALPIERNFQSREKSLAQIARAEKILANNGMLVLFPGGTRNAKDVKSGVGDMALKTQSIIVPISLRYPKHLGLLYWGRAQVVIHPPIDTTLVPYNQMNRKQLSQAIWEIISY